MNHMVFGLTTIMTINPRKNSQIIAAHTHKLEYQSQRFVCSCNTSQVENKYGIEALVVRKGEPVACLENIASPERVAQVSFLAAHMLHSQTSTQPRL